MAGKPALQRDFGFQSVIIPKFCAWICNATAATASACRRPRVRQCHRQLPRTLETLVYCGLSSWSRACSRYSSLCSSVFFFVLLLLLLLLLLLGGAGGGGGSPIATSEFTVIFIVMLADPAEPSPPIRRSNPTLTRPWHHVTVDHFIFVEVRLQVVGMPTAAPARKSPWGKLIPMVVLAFCRASCVA